MCTLQLMKVAKMDSNVFVAQNISPINSENRNFAFGLLLENLDVFDRLKSKKHSHVKY
jgi:hypothetical protein